MSVCKLHPTYKAIRPPRSRKPACTCWTVFAENHCLVTTLAALADAFGQLPETYSAKVLDVTVPYFEAVAKHNAEERAKIGKEIVVVWTPTHRLASLLRRDGIVSAGTQIVIGGADRLRGIYVDRLVIYDPLSLFTPGDIAYAATRVRNGVLDYLTLTPDHRSSERVGYIDIRRAAR